MENFANDFRNIMQMKEGPEVETAMYNFACNKPSKKTLIKTSDWKNVLKSFHDSKVYDQFIPPLVRVDNNLKPLGLVKKNDLLIYYDFRTDRAKPITAAFLGIPYEGQVGGLSQIAKDEKPLIDMVTMTHYDDRFSSSTQLKEAFNPGLPVNDTYVEVLAREGIPQLIAAESEKWRAVTWFKDGRRNLGYEMSSEDQLYRTDVHPKFPVTVKIVQSRKVASHISAPKMRAKEITDILLQGVHDGVLDIFANYANADMVGHAMTNLDWFDNVVEAILELDTQLGRLIPAALKAGYTIFITADHGNSEELTKVKKSKKKASPSHTSNKVPMIVLGLKSEEKVKILDNVTIGELGPMAIQLRGIKQPDSWNRKTAFVGNVKPEKNRKIMRLVLDGYGVRDDPSGNSMAKAAEKKGSPLHMDRWMNGGDGAVSNRAEASGTRCGYPSGSSGTTEFGHILFDAGREVLSDLLLIDDEIKRGVFYLNKNLVSSIRKAKKNGRTVHILGILSDGRVHSSLDHLKGIFEICRAEKLVNEDVSIHVITDGRDVPGDTSPKYFNWMEEQSRHYGFGNINSVWGRGWGKDRDNRWKRIEAAFRSMVSGTAAVHVNITAKAKL